MSNKDTSAAECVSHNNSCRNDLIESSPLKPLTYSQPQEPVSCTAGHSTVASIVSCVCCPLFQKVVHDK